MTQDAISAWPASLALFFVHPLRHPHELFLMSKMAIVRCGWIGRDPPDSIPALCAAALGKPPGVTRSQPQIFDRF
ncbi:MAG: hypothetical protein OJI74_08720 [Rhodanobacter thiooxydans]|nr:hypothetical protein [Rhodanobacter thiooxydans]